MKRKITDTWNRFTPEQKKKISILLAVSLFSLFGSLAYDVKKANTPDQKPAHKVEEIALDEDQLEMGALAQTQEIQELQDKQIQSIDDRLGKNEENMSSLLSAVNDLKQAVRQPAETKDDSTPVSTDKPPGSENRSLTIPPPPNPTGHGTGNSRYMAQPPVSPPKEPLETKLIGGISQETNKDFKPEPRDDDAEKKTANTLYLPPSFMEASLLSGVSAPTTSAAKKNPIQLFFRIKDLAILPNQVRANLKGCFVLGEGVGDLSTERVDVRLLRLSCVAKNGTAVIEEEVTGFVSDSDGKLGLKGNVVAKMGTHLARSLLAGFVGGIGEGVESSTKSSSFDVSGQTTEIFTGDDTANIIKAGVGSGISKASEELQDFYLELAAQTMPIIEVGATKKLTIIISKGVSLNIKNQRIGG